MFFFHKEFERVANAFLFLFFFLLLLSINQIDSQTLAALLLGLCGFLCDVVCIFVYASVLVC